MSESEQQELVLGMTLAEVIDLVENEASREQELKELKEENEELKGQIVLLFTQRDAAITQRDAADAQRNAAIREASGLRQRLATATAIAVRAEEKADLLGRENDIICMRMPRFCHTDDENKELGEIERNVLASRSLREEAERLFDETCKTVNKVGADWVHELRASVEKRLDHPVDVVTLWLPERRFSMTLAPDWRKMGPDRAVHYIWEKLGLQLRMTAAKAIDSAFRGGEK